MGGWLNTLTVLQGLVPLPRCDWHHWSGHHSSGASADPVADAFVVALFVVAAIGVLVSLISGGLLIVFTRRIRDMFWAIPIVNLAVYTLFLLVRPYPGGRVAQFRGEGLRHTLITVVLLLALSLILASVLGLLRLAVRAIRSAAFSPRHTPPASR